MFKALPECKSFFNLFFKQWYSKEDLKRRGYKNLRPDIESSPSFENVEMTMELQNTIASQIDRMVNAAADDWKGYLNITEKIELDWITQFDKHYHREKVLSLINSANPKDFSNDVIVLICEFGSIIGKVILNEP